MSKIVVIGAGGVGSVAVHKMAMNSDIFSHISLASRTKSKCDAIAASVKERTGVQIDTYALDADDVAATTALLKQIKPALVVNLALPYQDLNIMDACLAAGVNYMDTANYEPLDVAKFEYHWQWAYQERFKAASTPA
jgi:saccharopine dehydrogenase (NAD+, L-lysine forming)